MISSFLRLSIIGLFILACLGLAGVAGAYLYIAPKLPEIDTLKDVRLQVPLRVYAADGALMGEFGEMKREPLRYEEFPRRMIQAMLSAEDDRFFEHPGVDYQGILRAVIHLIRTGEKGQGGSTITMQVARNFFLSREKTYLRKLSEIFLALKIERELSKEAILELYLNKIYLGHRSYGVAAAAQVYYGHPIHELKLEQLAMIAGLPKAPSRYNPIVNPSRALLRRDYVLGRMRELEFISETDYRQAKAAPVSAQLHAQAVEAEAPYVAEMVRAAMVERFGDEAYTAGYKVYTTIQPELQAAANAALRKTLLAYVQRHGYRGPEGHVDGLAPDDEAQWDEALKGYSPVGGLMPALVTALEQQGAYLYTREYGDLYLPWEGLAWARPYIDDNNQGPKPKEAADILAVGDIIRIGNNERCDWLLLEVPEVAGALVSLNAEDGAVQSLVGGFDFYASKFNRVTQAERQPGSNFKPFVYSAALEKGYTLASVINDAPVVFEDSELEAAWRPENYSGKFFGPTRMREALVRSRNLVSIRILRSIGVNYAIGYLNQFGFEKHQLPKDLSLALGSASITPYQLAGGYAVFANGGYDVDPYFITRIEDIDGTVIEETRPKRVCRECELLSAEPAEHAEADAAAIATVEAELSMQADLEAVLQQAPRILEPRNVYLVTSMMQDVIRRGTGRRALALGRNDLAGKTGTTNEQRDAWFSGFNGKVVTTVWVGFDTPRPLGNRETGARAALPMWVEYMGAALQGLPDSQLEQPAGLVSVRIDPETGKLAAADNPNAIFEIFKAEDVEQRMQESAQASTEGGGTDTAIEENLSEQLF